MDPTTNDTDGDGLADGAEVTVDWWIEEVDGSWQIQGEVTNATAHPGMNDTDGDGVLDGKEVHGWPVDVVNKTAGNYTDENPFRWDSGRSSGPNETAGTVLFYGDPLQTDTDGDGIDDRTEKEVLHTDPEANQTYAITVKHQAEIVDELRRQNDGKAAVDQPDFYDPSKALSMLRLSGIDSSSTLGELELTDATDDFAFVTNEKGGLVSLGLDYTYRTDTWLSNEEVLDYRQSHSADLKPWDPDSDDDGLTDGQEIHGMTRFEPTGQIATLLKNGGAKAPSGVLVEGGILQKADVVDHRSLGPADPDSDGDGWWDGWIGVYNVGYNSEHVVRYMDDLKTGNGIEGAETIPKQADVHRVRLNGDPDTEVAPASRAVELYDDGWTYHSNVHLGELQWETNPTDGNDEPAPSMTLEVDYYEEAAQSVNTDSWAHGVERNYALYGIEVTVDRDEVLSSGDVQNPLQCASGISLGQLLAGPLGALLGGYAGSSACVEAHDGFSVPELAVIAHNHADEPSDQYLFVAHRPEDGVTLDPDNTGINLVARPTQAIFTEAMADTETFSDSEVEMSPYSTALAMKAAATQLHEIGHAFDLGIADDEVKPETVYRFFEVYSGDDGDNGDNTPEVLRQGSSDEWSLMARTTDTLAISPMNGRYFVFSIEELSTIKDP